MGLLTEIANPVQSMPSLRRTLHRAKETEDEHGESLRDCDVYAAARPTSNSKSITSIPRLSEESFVAIANISNVTYSHISQSPSRRAQLSLSM